MNHSGSSTSGDASRWSVLWHGPVLGSGGYADETRQFVLGLDSAGVRVRATPLRWIDGRAALPRSELARLLELTRTPARISAERVISVFHASPVGFWRISGVDYHIGRTMWETDRVPGELVSACDRMDEIWVPSTFNVESFARSGVPRSKLVRIPESIDVERFDLRTRPLPLPGRRGFNFLSVFDWQPRKAWDVLLRAFVEEFMPDEDVALFLKVWPGAPHRIEQIRREARSVLRRSGLARELPRHVIFMHANLHAADLPRLYKAVDAFVLPTRGEGWGRPFMEAMLMERPVVATRWSGQLEFLDDGNAYLVDCRLVDVPERVWRDAPAFRGHRWAEPSRAHLRRLMRRVVEDRETAFRKGRAGRATILASFSRETVAHQVKLRLQRIAQDLAGRRWAEGAPRPAGVQPAGRRDVPAVVWEGSQFVYHSLALVNRELCSQLIDAGCTVTLRPGSDLFVRLDGERWRKLGARLHAPPSRAPDVHVGHQWPPNLTPPVEGRWVVMQPWEFGSLPKRWLRAFSTEVDEVWVPSHHVRDGYIESGVPAERVVVVPNGVDGERFRPGAEALDLGRPPEFRFLFVGGTVYRKGIDLLLRAYRDAFETSDDVCLVIKDFGGDSFYRGQTFKKEILAARKRRDVAPILYLEALLDERELPGLYRACDALVHPYRGEGFGLPILEAMACGIPPIVTNGGACLDFCNETNSLPVPARKRHFDRRALPIETVRSPWFYEIDVRDLTEKMRYAYEHREELKSLGVKASEDARTHWTWRHAGIRALERIEALRTRPARRRRVFPPPAGPRNGRRSSAPGPSP